MTAQNRDECQDYPDLTGMCRLCLKENAGEIDIFESENSLVLRILTCTAIEIKSSDPFSKLICEKCRIDLERSYYFRKKSQNNNNKLKKHLRLINAGKKSTIFGKNSENDDDEFEFEDSLIFLKNIDEKEKQNNDKEILQKIDNIMKKREQEFYERENELIKKYKFQLDKKSKELKSLSERIILIKNEQKNKKEQYKRLMNKRYKTLTENCRKTESERILYEIREYINLNLATNNEKIKRKLIRSKKDNQILSKRQKLQYISPTKIKIKSEVESTTSTATITKETNGVEIFDVDSQPSERLNCNDAAATVNENNELEIGTTTIDDNYNENNDEEEKIQNSLTDSNDLQDNQHNESIEIIAYDEEELSDYDDDMQTGEYLRFNDNLKNNKIQEKDEEELEDCDENDDDDDDESNNTNIIDDENSFQFEQTTESNKADVNESYINVDKVEENVNMEKISDQVTKYELTTPEGDIIYMSLESSDDNSTTTTDTKKNLKNVTHGSNMVTTTTTVADFEKIVDDILSDDIKIKPSAVDDTVRIFRCKLCPHKYSREAQLARHVVVHDKTRQYACEYCDKWFACKSSLDRHIRVHTGEKPFKCDQCGRTFIQKEILKRHMLTHTGEKPYKCSHCDKSFAQKPILRSHINQYHTENPVREQHECHLCPKTFMHASGLSRHLISHTGIYFKCKECNKTFKDKSALKRHLFSIHGKEDKKSE